MAAILRKLSEELVVVLLIGLVSTTTAWTAIQASFHNNASSAAYGDYQLIIADANNLWITAEVKYRADLLTWDTGIGGSYEFSVYAAPCQQSSPESQLPDCTAYMDASTVRITRCTTAAPSPLRDRSRRETTATGCRC